MIKIKTFLFLLCCLISTSLFGNTPPDSSFSWRCSNPNPDNLYRPSIDDGTRWTCTSNVKPSRLGLMIGALLISDAIAFNKLADFWYQTETSTFHFHEGSRDIREYKQMDKISHMVNGYWISRFASKFFRWGGFSAESSIWLGSLSSFLWFLQIEVTDGFFAAWGFSYYDFLMNVAGCGYAALQQFYPHPFKGIQFKMSYTPSNAYKKDLYSTVSKSWVDDYEGFTFWLAINIYDVLPENWRRSYPGWLAPWGIAVGHGVQDIAQNVFNGRREIFIGLDFDLAKIPTGNSGFLKFMKDELNTIRLPLPAVCVSPSTVWFGFYFSQDL